MIRARLSDGTFLMGIDAGNVKRLKKGQPLNIDLRPLGGSDRVVIIYGETPQAIIAELERAGGPLPPAMPMPDEPPKGGH
jgi:hypothetical protein